MPTACSTLQVGVGSVQPAPSQLNPGMFYALIPLRGVCISTNAQVFESSVLKPIHAWHQGFGSGALVVCVTVSTSTLGSPLGFSAASERSCRGDGLLNTYKELGRREACFY